MLSLDLYLLDSIFWFLRKHISSITNVTFKNASKGCYILNISRISSRFYKKKNFNFNLVYRIYWLVKSNLIKSNKASRTSQIIKANLALKKEKQQAMRNVFYQMWAFALTRANYLDLCGWTSAMWTYEVEAVPVTASGLTWPPHSSAPFDLVSHSTTIFPISWAFYYTIAYHVVTVAESRETWRLKCALIISGSPTCTPIGPDTRQYKV